MPTDLRSLADQVSRLLAPFLRSLLKAAKRTGSAPADDPATPSTTRAMATNLWHRLWPSLKKRPAALEAARDVAEHPEDIRAQAAFSLQLEKVLTDLSPNQTEAIRAIVIHVPGAGPDIERMAVSRDETPSSPPNDRRPMPEPGVQPHPTGGDQITATHIRDSTVAMGRGAQVILSQSLEADELIRLFNALYARIQARPEDADVPKAELTETVQKIQDEVAKQDQANPNRVARWLKFLALSAPDIFEVAVATLTSPAAGVAAVIRKVAEKAKAEEAG